MENIEFVLSIDQRDEIIRAVNAIERQVNEIADQRRWQALYVIGSNLTRIKLNLTNLPEARTL